MASTPLADRLSALPLILAGPILRRTEPRAVTVWVALRERRAVTLRLYDLDTSAEPIPLFRGTRQTVRVGDHLHIVAVTARAADTDGPMLPAHLYGYDLFFGEAAAGEHVPPTAEHLASAGVLTPATCAEVSLSHLVYPGLSLPSFVLPADDLSQLRIFHGSCRNASGEGHDALAALDLVLGDSARDPAARPQQLFLTGDQIYADDVATPMLWALMEVGAALFQGDREEVLPDLEQPARALPPGTRTAVVRNLARFTTGTASSHLLSFAEYCAMYVCMWSDSLWPDAFPTVDELWQAFPQAQPQEENARERMAREYARELARLAEFRDALPAVRRALANIPTYMIFDDHDVTDDWFLDGAWCRDVLASALGGRIVRNALLAYAMFQGWGNDPEQFAGGDGAALLDAIDAWRGDEADPLTALFSGYLGLPASFAGTGELQHPEHALRWHYQVPASRYQVLVLDTRMQRTYPHPDAAPGLLSDRAVAEQVPASDAALTVLISQTPVLGVDIIEKFQFYSHLRYNNYAFDREAWSLNRRAYHHFIQALAQRRRVVILSGDVHYGFGSSLDWWELTAASRQSAKLVNFTSSSLCNQSAGEHKAILSALYPRLFHLLGHGALPPVDFIAWDAYTGRARAVHDAFNLLRGDALRFWWAAPRLLEVLRSKEPLVLPAHGWPAGAFADCPPDHAYRLTYLPDVLQLARERTEALSQIDPTLLEVEPDALVVTPIGATIQAPEAQHAARPVAPGVAVPHESSRALVARAVEFVRHVMADRHALDREEKLRQPVLSEELARHADLWTGEWAVGMHLVGDTNLGEIRYDVARHEAIQRLWWWHPNTPDRPTPATEYRASLDPPDPAAAPTLP